ncbi:sugar phosphate isomerase/epimerase family protein [Chryseolinea soli]|nr:TIM barrel protein [Chryseolinea soli]
MNPLESLSKPFAHHTAAAGFELLIFATNWGYTGSWDEFCAAIKKEGYDGAEAWYPLDATERKSFLDAFHKHNLKYGFLVGGSEADYQKHFQQFKTSLEPAALANPVYINCHSGRDHFSFEQNKTFIDLTTEVSERTKVPIYHETHRSRILYAAPVARQYMEKIAPLRITLDISHWCNVHESFLVDQTETVALALSRTGHIHARIGHAEGPQVNDPRAPEWKDAVDAHFAWWDKVVEAKRKEGKRLTMLTEFGPIDYMPAVPYTRQALANQWEINVHMLKTLRARYA